jgi:hypothetical protein
MRVISVIPCYSYSYSYSWPDLEGSKVETKLYKAYALTAGSLGTLGFARLAYASVLMVI